MRMTGCLVVLLCLAGCAEKDKVPSAYISRDKMQKIMWDMIQADQYSDMYFAPDSGGKGKIETLKLYAQIFRMYQVSREDFRKSFQYYISRPDLSRTLFDSILVMGSRERSAFPGPVPSKMPPVKGASPPRPGILMGRPGGSQIPFGSPGHFPNGRVSPGPLRGIPPRPSAQNPPPSSAKGLHAPSAQPAADSSARRRHRSSAHPQPDSSRASHPT